MSCSSSYIKSHSVTVECKYKHLFAMSQTRTVTSHYKKSYTCRSERKPCLVYLKQGYVRKASLTILCLFCRVTIWGLGLSLLSQIASAQQAPPEILPITASCSFQQGKSFAVHLQVCSHICLLPFLPFGGALALLPFHPSSTSRMSYSFAPKLMLIHAYAGDNQAILLNENQNCFPSFNMYILLSQARGCCLYITSQQAILPFSE